MSKKEAEDEVVLVGVQKISVTLEFSSKKIGIVFPGKIYPGANSSIWLFTNPPRLGVGAKEFATMPESWIGACFTGKTCCRMSHCIRGLGRTMFGFGWVE